MVSRLGGLTDTVMGEAARAFAGWGPRVGVEAELVGAGGGFVSLSLAAFLPSLDLGCYRALSLSCAAMAPLKWLWLLPTGLGRQLTELIRRLALG